MKSRSTLLTTASVLVATVAGVVLVALPAQADIFEDFGLTGGSNHADFKGGVSGTGKLTFHLNDYDDGNGNAGKPSITDYVGPKAKAEVTCHRDGYRVAKIGDVSFPRKATVEDAEVLASLTDEKASIAALTAACKNKKTSVQLPVTVRGVCGKKSSGIVIGPSRIGVGTPKAMANFTITCTDMEDGN